MNRGFFCIQGLILLFILSFLCAGIAEKITLTQTLVRRNQQIQADRNMIVSEIQEIILDMRGDPTPESDAPIDPVWDRIRHRSPGFIRYELSDISSRLNLNWMNMSLFDCTDAGTFLLNGVSADMVRHHRSVCGYGTDIGRIYAGIVEENALYAYFTGWGYLNINTADDTAIRDMYESLIGDRAKADTLHLLLDNSKDAGTIFDDAGFAAAAGADYTSVFPLIGTLPEMNVHFVPEFLLEQVLALPYGGNAIGNHQEIADLVLRLREHGEITPLQLQGLIETEGMQDLVFHHLGTKTWFWKLCLSTERIELTAIIACVPVKQHYSGGYSYRICSVREDI